MTDTSTIEQIESSQDYTDTAHQIVKGCSNWSDIQHKIAPRIVALLQERASVVPQGDAFTAYNQAIEDALAAIREESQGGGYWAATFINAVARKCSPHVYVASLPPNAPSPELTHAIVDMRAARNSHVQWAEHLRDTERDDCQGCADHAEHVGDAAYHDEWVEKYDNVIKLLSATPSPASSPVGHDWHAIICPVIAQHCQGIQLPKGIVGLENDLIAALRSSSPVPPEQDLRSLLGEFLWDKYGCTIEHHRMKVLKHFVEWAESRPPVEQQLREVDERVNAGVVRMDASQKVDAATMQIDLDLAATSTPVEQEQTCIKCNHADGVDNNGWCLHNRPYDHNPATSLCGCKCEFATLSPSVREAAEAAAREVIDAVWSEAKKLAESFVKANIRNYNDHKGVESLERVYDAKRDTAQQIFNQMHNFNEARWKRPNDIVEIILKYCSPVSAAGGDEDNELKRKATQYFRWAYQLLLALAKRRLADANMENQVKGEPDNWPAGQAWHEMNGTSHSIFLRGARAEAGIPEEAFMGVIRSLEVDVEDLYAAADSVGEEGK